MGGPDTADGARGLTHVDETGAARMVDVSDKDVTTRTATASGRVLVSAEVARLLRGEGMPKGDALGVARVAGIQGAKLTPTLIPLCHPLPVTGVTVDLDVVDTAGDRAGAEAGDGERGGAVHIAATVRTTGRTGVEMEALSAVTVAALTVVDMVKAVDKAAVITDVRVETKSGGASGDWAR